MYEVHDSGKREEFDTGSRRDTRDGKGRYDLLPTRAISKVACHFEVGAKKYGPNNWRLGQPISRYIDSALRHLMEFLEGKNDEPHHVAAAWNVLCLIETIEMVKEGLLPEKLIDVPYTRDRILAEQELFDKNKTNQKNGG